MGTFFLLLSWLAALGLVLIPGLGEYFQAPRLLGLARPWAWALLSLVSLSFLFLVMVFVNNDFHYVYVAAHSSLQLPLIYRMTATWGGHEGSLLLWVWLLNIWSSIFLLWYPRLSLRQFHYTLMVLGLINLGLLSLLVFTSSPFDWTELVLTGQDLNPLLQDPGMVSHPPLLYLGYVGYACVYAYAIAGLFQGSLSETWLSDCRRLSQMAWSFLTVGITLGSWWAYRELGWGGYWFWDPVENAALMPWLCGTALIHTLKLVKKQPGYLLWSLVLIILAFSLSILGTFLVRSGVSISVHAFASDPARGAFLLLLFALILLASFALLILRSSVWTRSSLPLTLLSRPQLLLICSMLMTVLLGSVMLGTFYPIFLAAVLNENISVGPPYYELIFIPMGWLILIAMGLIEGPNQTKKMQVLAASLFCMVALLFFYGPERGLHTPSVGFFGLVWALLKQYGVASVGLVLCFWTLLQTLRYAFGQYQKKGVKHGHYGVILGHLGLVIFGLGLVLSTALTQEEQLIMHTGEQARVGSYMWRLKESYGVVGPNYRGVGAEITVQAGGGGSSYSLYPEKRIYTVSQQIMTDADIHPGLVRDLFVSLGEPLDQNTWSLRISVKPFIRFIWIGALIMALGGLIAAVKTRTTV